MSGFRPGEIVDITIKGARVEWANSTDMNVWAVDEVDPDTGVNLGEQVTICHTAENVTVERVVPAEWPPRPGDLWRDHDGDVWFCRTWQIEGGDWVTGMVCARRIKRKSAFLGGSTPEGRVARDHGPLTLVHREDEQDGPAMSDPLRQELHAMKDVERFAALAWVLDHHPDAFAGAARYVRKMRALAAGPVRKEARDATR